MSPFSPLPCMCGVTKTHHLNKILFAGFAYVYAVKQLGKLLATLFICTQYCGMGLLCI